jgi:integrase
MASLSKDKTRDGYRLSFWIDKRKKSIWLGGVTKRMAETVKGHVEHLVVAKAAGTSVDPHTAHWLGSISQEIRSRLVKATLVEATAEDHGPVTLGPFLDAYLAHRRDVKDSTRTQYNCAIRSLVGFFGAGRRLDSITVADVERWRIHSMENGNCRDAERISVWGDNTLRRSTGRARQFFAHAVKLKLIDENPFEGFAVSVHGNTKRQRFITQETIKQALAVCTCPEMRCVIALSRFAGIRTPSETVGLTWADVDFEAGRLTIRAPKNERYEDGGIRFCPIFPELRPFLQELHDRVNPGLDCPMSTPVISRWRSGDQNLRTAFLKLLEKAGIKAWPKLYQNLRATRQTELLAQFPAKDVCDWLGNTQAVAMRHYAMSTSESFERAVGSKAEQDCCSTCCSISVDQELSGDGPKMKKPSKTIGFEGFCQTVISKQAPRDDAKRNFLGGARPAFLQAEIR